MTELFAHVSSFITHVISTAGYFGVGALMAIESAAIPLPSEIIMPFAGYLVSIGRFSLLGISLAGAIGSVVGSAILYAIGYYGGRPLVIKYGKYILVREEELQRAENFFNKYGVASNLIGRMLPVVRTFISFPAGVAKTEVKKFLLYSFIGSFIWSLFLGWIGLELGQNWESLRNYFHKFDYAIVALVILLIIWYVYKKKQYKA